MTIAYSGDSITFPDNSVQNTAATGFGFKNRIINGQMVIDQRNAGASVSNPANGFAVDRFPFDRGVSTATLTVQRSTTAPTGFTNSLAITVGTGAAINTGDYSMLRHAVEGFNVADLGWGTANAQTITLSFWVRSSLTGTFGVSFLNNTENRRYAAAYTINAANTWEQKTITVAGDTSGTWTIDNSAGIKLYWDMGCGSTYSATAGSWGAGASVYGLTGGVKLLATSGATFYITGVQLEKGSTATSFDYRPYGTELALCQRYAYAANGSNGLAGSGDTVSIQQRFSLPTMRSTPTLTTITAGSAIISDDYSGNYTAASAGFALQNANSQFARVVITGFSGLTSGRFAAGLGTGTGVILFSAEL